jgi:hypothetical protein
MAVQLQTVKGLLKEIALRRIQLTPYRFCSNAACGVVYFGDAGDRFGTGGTTRSDACCMLHLGQTADSACTRTMRCSR